MAKVAIIDPGMGNLRSVERAFLHCGAEVTIIKTPAESAASDTLVFPGQGAIVNCMDRLKDTGFDRLIHDWIDADRPFFGICLGFQALFEFSEEGDTEGLGIFPGKVRRFVLPKEFKIPHMGWNDGTFVHNAPLTEGLRTVEQYYFVHSYYVDQPDENLDWFRSEYGGIEFTSGIAKGNCFATQFHPEKSQAKGLQLYRNFLDLVDSQAG
jgi:glutamine amidotransferase